MSIEPLDVAALDTYWILRRDQLRCLASPVRSEIIDHLAAHGTMSIKELAAAIGKAPTAIYHHLKLLLDVDLIEVAGTRTVNRKSEKLYRTPSRRMRMVRALADPANADIMRDFVACLSRQMVRDFSTGIDSPHALAEGEDRTLGFFRLVNRPDKEALREINDHLAAIAEILWRDPDPNAPLLSFAWVMSPMGGGPAKAQTGDQ